MRVIFMGTPDFAVGTLRAIAGAGHEVAMVVSQPDKAVGRSRALRYTPVKACAIELGIPTFQPERVRDAECVEAIRRLRPDIIVVVAFGQIIPREVLDIPPCGCVNVHASLLPKYRGAAPIQWAILNGERETGVTTMRMDEGLDTGDVIMQEAVGIAPDDTAGSLSEKLSEAGARLCAETMRRIEGGEATYTPQDEALATHTSKIRREMGSIDWKNDAKSIERQIRGLSPWPGSYARLSGKTVKVWRARVIPDGSAIGGGTGIEDGAKGNPGCILRAGRGGIAVQTGSGALEILELQLEGKKRMPAEAFLNGFPVREGDFFQKG